MAAQAADSLSPSGNPSAHQPTAINGMNGSAHQQNGNGAAPDSAKPRNGTFKDTIKKKKGPPGGFDPTPLPDAPQGYDVQFSFQRATNLPIADYGSMTSDPFIIATLKAANPKRHKDDPDLTHRTRTLRNTTEPQWEDKWIVANVPATGFTLKCRLYDEDSPDRNDRLGNVTIEVPQITDTWEGVPSPGTDYPVKKRVISKRALVFKFFQTLLTPGAHMTPFLTVSIKLLKKSDPPYAQMCTLGPTTWFKHFSPMIGRIAGTKVNANDQDDHNWETNSHENTSKSQKYDFQSNEMQLQGPVPSKLYHRYVEFRPFVGSMFASTGIRGKILHALLHKQHERIYNFNSSTEYGEFEPCSKEAALQFLRLVHFDEGGRLFTYVLTLDGMLRFTETGKEFGIDLLSKHTMHSDVEKYIACSGEFFVRRLQHPDASEDLHPRERTHPTESLPNGPPGDDPPLDPSFYQLVIDNDSGTYRPDKSVLPDLKEFLHKNFPGLGIVAMHWEDKELQKLKEAQINVKKREGRMVNLVMNRSQSSLSSAESELDHREGTWESGTKSKREAAFAAIEDPSTLRESAKTFLPYRSSGTSKQG
ncbi:hypothetical protein B0I35DRAFT_437013 [Stachybotrys elegans]|uniref:C2 domain-containing protein n=1 Tax=Stachybotrys elegans TaxID=80388 RepID=A0A8K0SMA4_9HYPO|nr:hypothetical protein B0I35DRAFT_437013 [Stachybotrys elegans]